MPSSAVSDASSRRPDAPGPDSARLDTPDPDDRGLWWALGGLVTGKWSAVLTLLVGLALAGGLFSIGAPDSSAGPNGRPAGAESTRVQEIAAEFEDGATTPAIAVFTRTDGGALTREDLAAAADTRDRMLSVERGPETGSGTTADTTATRVPLVPSPDGKATTAVVPISNDRTGSELATTIDEVRDASGTDLPEGLSVQLTGGPAFGADTAGAFAGADLRLLLVTSAVVAVLLLITYRSPILWLVPLIVVGLADRVAQIASAHINEAVGLPLDGSTTGITSVLVFGAGTNYALLLVSRYREELRRTPHHRLALRRALRHTGPAVLASNVTVVLALLTLLVAAIPSTRILGVAAATGLLCALVAAVFVLPAVLALCGRGLFWPFVPKVGDPDRGASGRWYGLARGVARRPWTVLAVTVPLLAVCALSLRGAHRPRADRTVPRAGPVDRRVRDAPRALPGRSGRPCHRRRPHRPRGRGRGRAHGLPRCRSGASDRLVRLRLESLAGHPRRRPLLPRGVRHRACAARQGPRRPRRAGDGRWERRERARLP